MEWLTMPATTAEVQLIQLLDAIAYNSRGRYGIVYHPHQKGENDYLVEISTHREGRTVKSEPRCSCSTP